MLSGLRPGTPVYLLYKNEPRLATAKVVSISNQYPQFNFQQPLNSGNGPVIDLCLEIDGKTESFPRIPLNSSIVEFPDKAVIISETRDGIINEINVIRGASQSALEQIEAHKRVIEACDKLMVDLNPQLKHEQEQAGKIARLEEQLAGMSDQIAALTGMISKTLGKKKEE